MERRGKLIQQGKRVIQLHQITLISLGGKIKSAGEHCGKLPPAHDVQAPASTGEAHVQKIASKLKEDTQ